jgi:predicted hotdog family 3-hydroxylacyl-ACP dehydratase
MDARVFLALPAEQLTAHQPPALLVERALHVDGVHGRVRLKPHQGLDCLQMMEACAQAMAVIMGLRMRGDGVGEAASGMLVGAKNITLLRPIAAGENVEIHVTQSMELGPLHLYDVRAEIGGEVVMTGEIKAARTGGAT